MRNTFSPKLKVAVAVVAVVALGTSLFAGVKPAAAAAGDVSIGVQTELATTLNGATLSVACTGGTAQTVTDGGVGDSDGVANGTILVLAATIGNATTAECDDGETFTVKTVALDGYVTATSSLTTYSTAGQNNATASLSYSHKFVTKDELNAALTVTSATAGALAGTTCVISTNNVYCPIILADDNTAADGLVAVKDGYVTTTASATPLGANRTANTDAQSVVTQTGTNGLDFAYTLTAITTETLAADITATATTVEVGDDTGRNACALTTGVWYCPVVLANSNGTMIARIAKDGYVEKTNYALTTAANRTTGVTAQRSDTVAGIQYAVKATVTALPANAALSGATVVTGNALAVSCTENGSTGVYFCIVPLAHTGVVVDASKAGYSSGTESFTDRTSATDAQRTVAPVLAVISGGSGNHGGGGGGGGSSTPSTPATPTEETPAPIVPAPTPAPVVTPAPTATTTLHMILDEKNFILDPVMLRMNTGSAANPALEASTKAKYASLWTGMTGYSAVEMNAVTNFIAYGTGTTRKIGSGERAAAVSAYKEAYGTMPKTASDWQDVLNIANGYWPITVNKATEARAYVNFKAVYGRDANMKNSTDVNALKMMGYGVRSMKARDMKMEASASMKFKATFGYAPTTARHWNIVRAIAYSGVVK